MYRTFIFNFVFQHNSYAYNEKDTYLLRGISEIDIAQHILKFANSRIRLVLDIILFDNMTESSPEQLLLAIKNSQSAENAAVRVYLFSPSITTVPGQHLSEKIQLKQKETDEPVEITEYCAVVTDGGTETGIFNCEADRELNVVFPTCDICIHFDVVGRLFPFNMEYIVIAVESFIKEDRNNLQYMTDYFVDRISAESRISKRIEEISRQRYEFKIGIVKCNRRWNVVEEFVVGKFTFIVTYILAICKKI